MSYSALFYHLVFSTKERQQFLKGDMLTRCCKYMGALARDLKSDILQANGAPDHVHIAATLPPMLPVSDFVGKLKCRSSGWMHRTFPMLSQFDWQDGYAAFTVSPSVLPAVKEYTRNQQRHHREATFEEELAALLRKHGIAFDPPHLLA